MKRARRAIKAVNVKVLRLKPGDTIVLTFPKPLSKAAAMSLRDYAERHFKAPVTILDDGLDIAVLRNG